MNYTMYYHAMSELLKQIREHILENAHAIILVNDYLALHTVYNDYDVNALKEAIERNIRSAKGWEEVKNTFIPTLAPDQIRLLRPLLD